MANGVNPVSGEVDSLFADYDRNATASLSAAGEYPPEDAALASEYSTDTNYPSTYIARNLKDFEARHKTAMAVDIMRQNPYIMRYINAHPMAASVSQNDWGALDQASNDYLALHRATQRPWWQIGAIGALHGAGEGAGQIVGGVGRLSGSEYLSGLGRRIMQSVDTGVPLSREEQDSLSAQVGSAIGGMASLIPALLAPEAAAIPVAAGLMGLQTGEAQAEAAEAKGQPTAVPFATGAALGAATGALPVHLLTGEAAKVGGPGLGQWATAKLKEALKTGALMSGISEAGDIINTEIAKSTYDPTAKYSFDMQRMAANLIGGSIMGAAFSKVRPWIDASKPVPKGVDPTLDQIIAGRAKVSNDLLDAAIDSRLKTDTSEQSQRLLDVFYSTHPDARMELDGEAVRKLYGDKTPELDDGILGWVPDIKQQLATSLVDGGDISVSLRDYVSKVDKEVNDQLHDFRRIEPGGMTLDEAKELPPQPMSIGPLSAMRSAAGTDKPTTIVREAFGDLLRGDQIAALKGLLPPDARMISSVTDEGYTVPASYTFPVKSLIPRIDTTTLEPGPKLLQKFFGNRIMETAGDIPVYTLPLEQLQLLRGKGQPASAFAFYSGISQRIYLPEELFTQSFDPKYVSGVIMEEASHAATIRALFESPRLNGKLAAIGDYLHEYLSTHDPEAYESYQYALSNTAELLAWSQSHGGFQKVLMRTPLSDGLAKRLDLDYRSRSIWDAIRVIVRDLLKQLTGKDPPTTVMDAMFKIGQEAQRVMTEIGGPFGPLKGLAETPMSREALGLTKKDFEERQKRVIEQATRDQEKLRDLDEKRIRQRQTKEWKDDRDAERQAAIQTLIRRPDIAADRFLREGMLYNEKVRRARLREDMLSPEQKAALSPDWYSKPGLPPDDVAELFGYSSGDEMISHLSALHADRTRSGLTPRDDFRSRVENETDRRMKAKFGDLDTNVLKELEDHVYSADEGNMLSQVLLRLGIKAGVIPKDGKIDVDAMRRMAEASFRDRTVGAVDPDRLADQGGRKGREIEALATADKHVEAYKAAEDRQITFLETIMARDLEDLKSKFNKIAGRYRKLDVAGVGGADADWIRVLLNKMQKPIGRKPESLEKIVTDPSQEFPDLMSWLEDKDKTWGNIFVPDFLINNPKWSKSVDKMTVAEYRAMSGLIMDLDHYARKEQKLTVQGHDEDREEFKGRLLDTLKKNVSVRKWNYNSAGFAKFIGDAKSILHMAIQAETDWNRADGGDPTGPWKRFFSYGASDAANAFNDLVTKYGAMLREIGTPKDLKKKLDPLFVRPSSRTEENPEGTWLDMTRANLIQIMRNMGTDSNFTKLAGGWRNPSESIDQAKTRITDYVNRNATKEDWDFVRKEGEVYEKIFKEATRMIIGMGGRVPEIVSKRRVETPHGTFEGWYHPMIYDQVEEGSSRKLMGLKGNFDPEGGLEDSGYFRATTAKGWSKQRTGYIAPVYLKMDRSGQRMTSVLRDIAFRPYIADAAKLVYDSGFTNRVKNYLGDIVVKKWDPYLKALGGVGEAPQSAAESILDGSIEFFRRNLISQLIGWNPVTVGKHGLSAAINSLAQVGPLNWAREARMLRSYTLDPEGKMNNWDYAMASSGELRGRHQSVRGTVSGEYARLAGAGEDKVFGRQWWYEKGTYPVAQIDLLSAVPTWIAAYKDAFARLTKEDPTGNNHTQAVSEADYAVRYAHGSSKISSRPEIMRTNAVGRMFTSLYGFFNQALQRNYEAYWRTKLGAKQLTEGQFRTGAEQLSKAALLLVTGVIAPALVEELITPYSNKEHDSLLTWGAKTLALGASGTLPVVRELTHMIVAGGDTGGLIGSEYKELGNFATDIEHGARMMDAQHGGKTLRDANAAFGLLTGKTNNIVGNLFKTTWDLAHSTKETPRTPYELARDIGRGHPRDERR